MIIVLFLDFKATKKQFIKIKNTHADCLEAELVLELAQIMTQTSGSDTGILFSNLATQDKATKWARVAGYMSEKTYIYFSVDY